MRYGVFTLSLALLPTLAHATPSLAAGEDRGLLGPIIVLLIIVLLNIAVLALAIRLRRYFLSIGDQGEQE